MKKFLLVDVSAMYFRAFYAIRHLTNSKGLPTNALYGFLSMSHKLLEKFQPDYLAYCFDRKDPSFRKDMYPDYKANRSEMPEDLVPQVPYVLKIAEALGAKCIDIPKYEADDIIGMLAKFGEEKNVNPMIISGDKDFAQLITDKTTMYEPTKEIHYDKEMVEVKWGVKPEQIIDYLALIGDSSDNIPGVKGVGPKGAQKLLNEYGSLKEIYEKIDSVKNKNLQTKLIESKEIAFLSHELVTIVTENKTGIDDIEEFRWNGYNEKELRSLLEELEFHSFIKKNLDGKKEKKPAKKIEKGLAVPKVDTEVLKGKFPVLSKSHLPEEKIKITENISDISTDKNIFSFVFQKEIYLGQENLLFKVNKESFSSSFSNWSGFNIKSIWRELDVENAHIESDLQLIAYTYSSKDVRDENFLIKSIFLDDPEILDNVQDYYQALKLIEKSLLDLLEKEEKVLELYNNIEKPVAEILYNMECSGISLDVEELNRQKEEITHLIEKLKLDIQKELEVEINLDSPKQLSHVLFEVKGLPVIKKTKTGYSTDSEVLEKLSYAYPFCKNIIEYRELKKLLSTYIVALPKLVNEKTQKIHSHFNQAVTSTGRLSSSNPNLQNIPIRTKRGNDVRKAFVADEGKVLISADYSQIELRVLAHITKDPALAKAFKDDIDIHTLTASEVFGEKLENVDSEMRRRAKAVNFGIAYGMGAYSLAENLQISRADAKNIIDTYFKRFKNVKEYMQDIVLKAKEQGYVESIFGRRRYIEEIHSSKPALQKFGERAAINAPIQSSASDIVKKAMIDVMKTVHAEMLLQVHDELIFQCAESEVEFEMKKIKEAMENTVKLEVPLKVNLGKGKNWQEAH